MSKWLLIVGVVLGLVTVVFLNLHIQDIEARQQSQPFLRLQPSVQLTKGDKIDPGDLRTENLPESLRELRDVAIPDTEDSRAWLAGRAVTRDVPAGGFLLHEYFTDDPGQRFATKIQAGMRAVTIPVDGATAVAYFVEPGSMVDVLGTFVRQGGAQEEVLTRTILQNIRVLAVAQATTRGSYLGAAESGFSTVTLEVTSHDAEKLVFAMRQAEGGLTLALRNPGDQQVVNNPATSWGAVISQ